MKKTAAQKPTEQKARVKIEEIPVVKSQVMPEDKIEIKTEVHEPNYPNYMESIESVINASKEVMKPEPKPIIKQIKVNTNQNQLPFHDHQYSRITFYGSGDLSETKSQETVESNEKTPAKTEVKARKRPVQAKKMPSQTAISKPLQKSHQVIRPKPMIYRFNPSNGLIQPTPAYFVPSIASTSSTFAQYTPTVAQSNHGSVPNIYANATVPLQFKTPVRIVQGSAIQQPIYYLQFCKPQE